MKIDSIKQLDRLLALCQKRGVTAIKVDGIELQVLPHNQATKRGMIRHDSNIDTNVFPEESIKVPTYTPVIDDGKVDEETLTDEQMLFYSARPETPEQDQ